MIQILVAQIFLTIAGAMDVRDHKVSNLWILSGYIAGLSIRVWYAGLLGIKDFIWDALWPILLLYLLFLIRAIGAADVKVFSALSTILMASLTIRVLVCSFVLGAIFSIVRIKKTGDGFARLIAIRDYAVNIATERKFSAYQTIERPESYMPFVACIAAANFFVMLLEVMS